MVAFVTSIVILVVGIGVCFLVARARPPGTPLTWGEAMVAGTFVFALLVLGYGVVPHEWLEYADNELLWRADKIAVGVSSEGVKTGAEAKQMGGAGRILVNYQAVRDLVATVIYGVFLAAQIYLWSVWQKQGRKTTKLEPVSAYGRPLMRKV